MKKHGNGGNGSTKFTISSEDMGGWVRVFLGQSHGIPTNLPICLSHELTEWFRRNPTRRLRCVVPQDVDGNTVELHAWYDTHVEPAKRIPAGGG